MTRKTKLLSFAGGAAMLALATMALPNVAPSFSVPTAEARASSKATVDAAKSAGIVGEQADGYLGLVTGTASSEIRAAVNDINIQRKQAYTRMARDKGESVENVGKVFALDLISRVPSGQMYRDGNGSWKRK